jgi:hypothetical protein
MAARVCPIYANVPAFVEPRCRKERIIGAGTAVLTWRPVPQGGRRQFKSGRPLPHSPLNPRHLGRPGPPTYGTNPQGCARSVPKLVWKGSVFGTETPLSKRGSEFLTLPSNHRAWGLQVFFADLDMIFVLLGYLFDDPMSPCVLPDGRILRNPC